MDPPKKIKTKQTFRDSYIKKWTFLRQAKSEYHVNCTTCKLDINISHGGSNDIERHIATDKHKKNSIALSTISDIRMFQKQGEDLSTIRAESIFTNFVIMHNLPFSVADHITNIFPKMFPDSKIAKTYACKHTKTAAVANCIGENTQKKVVEKMRVGYFSIATDGSGDRHAKHQTYPVVSRYYDCDVGRVVSVLLSALGIYMLCYIM
jgi:hypothetical protein